MKVKKSILNNSDEHSRVDLEIQIDDKVYNIYFQSSKGTVLSKSVESSLICSMLPCMQRGGCSLVLEGEISQQFVSSLSTIQDIYTTWDTSLERMQIENVKEVSKEKLTSARTGAFFSGGLDSFYTLVKHQDEITDLILVHGLDIKLENTVLREVVSKKIHDIAESFGKNVIEIETNVRDILDPYVAWGPLGHGLALAAVGHQLSSTLKRVYIASSDTYTELIPWGTHPLLDPLWSTESLEFVHDGCEAGRVKKTKLIKQYPIALQTLRVCWRNPDSVYNCGRCEKCIRTMVNLKVNHVLQECSTFDAELDIKYISKKMFREQWDIVSLSWRDNIEALENNQDDEFNKKLLKLLKTPSWKLKIKQRFYKLERKITRVFKKLL